MMARGAQRAPGRMNLWPDLSQPTTVAKVKKSFRETCKSVETCYSSSSVKQERFADNNVEREVTRMSESNLAVAETTEDGMHEWLPNKPADKYSDDEIKALDIYKSLRSFSGRVVKDPQVLSTTRDMIAQMWKGAQQQALRDEILPVFAAALARGIEVGEAITIYPDGSYCPAKGTGDRFKLGDYAKLIGKGPFLHTVKQARTATKNGTYSLFIEEALPGSQKPFSARLVQKNGNKSAPVIVFPPADPEAPKETAERKEVASMSQMMKASDLQSPLTPGVVFRLKDVLEPAGKVSEDDEDDVEDEDEPEAPRARSRAHAALDDED